MKVVYVSNDVKQMDIADELEVYYDMIDCRCIDIVTRKIGKEWYYIICDDEGLLAGKNPTAFDATGTPMLVGNLIICRHDGEDLAGLTAEDVDNIAKHIGYYRKDGKEQWCIVSMSF